MNIQLLLLQIIAHILSDYFFQTDKSATEKNKKGFQSKYILEHAFVTFICSWIASFDINFIGCSIGIALTHYVIDGLKKTLNKSKYSFFIDQLLHLAIILLFVWIYNQYFEANPILTIPFSVKWIFLVLSYLICLKPANIFIREIMRFFKIKTISSTDGELENAGKLIGILERILVLTLVIIKQYEAIGFLITAKSILRYKDTNTIKTEYVLIGTMTSFAIAMTFGILFGKF